ncbi:MAG: hypothetical protein R2720_14080 [Candidatus Nanopelagicales bacterium]
MEILLAAESQQVTAWPQRLALTVVVLIVIALSVWGMYRSYQRRAAVELPVEPRPSDFVADMAVEGRYLGTSPAADWMQRVAANGMGAPGNATAAVGRAGVLMTRVGESDIFIGIDQITDVWVGRGVAGQVAEKDGVVLWNWHAGQTALQSGFRPDAADDVMHLAQASQRLLEEIE